MLPRPMIGILLASAAGVFWGSMSIAAQYLMEAVSFDAIDLASLRLAGAGVLLLALEALVLREDVLAPFRDRKDRRDIVFYALGMLGIQLTFFLSIRDANAATAALMRARSCSSGTRGAPGRVDSAPRSSMSAPWITGA